GSPRGLSADRVDDGARHVILRRPDGPKQRKINAIWIRLINHALTFSWSNPAMTALPAVTWEVKRNESRASRCPRCRSRRWRDRGIFGEQPPRGAAAGCAAAAAACDRRDSGRQERSRPRPGDRRRRRRLAAL